LSRALSRAFVCSQVHALLKALLFNTSDISRFTSALLRFTLFYSALFLLYSCFTLLYSVLPCFTLLQDRWADWDLFNTTYIRPSDSYYAAIPSSTSRARLVEPIPSSPSRAREPPSNSKAREQEPLVRRACPPLQVYFFYFFSLLFSVRVQRVLGLGSSGVVCVCVCEREREREREACFSCMHALVRGRRRRVCAATSV